MSITLSVRSVTSAEKARRAKKHSHRFTLNGAQGWKATAVSLL